MRDLNELPDGWRVARLGDVARIARGVSWSREQESSSPLAGTVPVVRIGNVQPDGIHMDDTLYIKRVSEAEKRRRAITNKTIIMVGSNGNRDRVGNTFLATSRIHGHLLASFLIGIEPLYNICERFLSSSLKSHRTQSLISRSTSGSTGIKNLGLNWLRDLEFLLPPIAEQRAIAGVLDAIDEAIERTEAVIGATERLRDALLHELLTRGVPGWHTEWRTVPGLGTVPADWQVVRLADCIAEGPTNGIYKPASDYGSGTWLIRIDDFIAGALIRSDGFERIRVSDDEAERYSIREGDILINRVNSLSHLGKSVLIPQLAEKALFESNMMKIRTCAELNSEFAMIVLLSRASRRYFIARAKKAVQQSSINQQDVSELSLPLPGSQEQELIAQVSMAMSCRLRRARGALASMVAVQASAGEMLLTGQARVTGENRKD